jgi:hypothetical protein
MNNNRRFIPGKGFIFFLIIIPGILLFGLIVMLLWNAILPSVAHVNSVTYPQALGILVLSKILFGGFNKRHWGGKWRNEMRERFANMTPEEKERFKAEWKDRCNNWRRREETSIPPTTEL